MACTLPGPLSIVVRPILPVHPCWRGVGMIASRSLLCLHMGGAGPFGLAFGPEGCLFVSEFNTDTVWRICRDEDKDSVPNDEDDCPGTPAGEVVDARGCAIGQWCPCEHDWKNHGQYVSCVAHTSKDFEEAGLITNAERAAIVSAAAQSSCGKKK